MPTYPRRPSLISGRTSHRPGHKMIFFSCCWQRSGLNCFLFRFYLKNTDIYFKIKAFILTWLKAFLFIRNCVCPWILSPSVHNDTAFSYASKMSQVAIKLSASLSTHSVKNFCKSGHLIPLLCFNIILLTFANAILILYSRSPTRAFNIFPQKYKKKHVRLHWIESMKICGYLFRKILAIFAIFKKTSNWDPRNCLKLIVLLFLLKKERNDIGNRQVLDANLKS